MKSFEIHEYDEPRDLPPAVEPPNSVPTKSQFDTYTENYCAGLPGVPTPQWLIEATEKYHTEA